MEQDFSSLDEFIQELKKLNINKIAFSESAVSSLSD